MPSINAFVKRTFDIFCAAIGLIALSPIFVAASIAVALSSQGPVIFRQTRIGRFGQPFEILKFRTMTVDAPGVGPQITIGNDRRITRVGRFLRRYKFDELPQLINVLKGEMSLVGPRPEVPAFVALYQPDQRDVILSVRPGITDNASLEFRNESELLSAAPDPEAYYRHTILPRKCALYVEYAKGNNAFRDLIIIAKTISVLFRNK